MNVSDNIRAIRKEKGMTQTEVAKRYGTSPEFYHRLEKKGQSLTLEQAGKLAEALEVSIAELLGLEQGNQEKLLNLEQENNKLRLANAEILSIRKDFEIISKQLLLYDELFKERRNRNREIQEWAADTIRSIEAGDINAVEKLVRFIKDIYLSDTD